MVVTSAFVAGVLFHSLFFAFFSDFDLVVAESIG